MIENQFNSEPLPNNWHINDFNKERENQRVIRTFINSAIYVEKAVTEMPPPSRKTSPLSIIDNSNESKIGNIKQDSDSLKNTYQCTSKTATAKTPKSSDIMPNELSNCYSLNMENGDESKMGYFQEQVNTSQENMSQKTSESGYKTNDHSSNHSSIDTEYSFQSQTTVKPRVFKSPRNANSELRLSLSYLNSSRTDRTSSLDPKEKKEIIQSWLDRKESEQRRKAAQEARLMKQKEEERLRLIEKERETFRKWLAEKKKEEERKKLQKEVDEQELKLREAEKEKKKVENEISFNLWLRKKKKYDLEKRIREKIALLNMYEEKQNRMEENEKAYQEWLNTAKTRPKPIPMNRGLQSLCSSTSVTYINPLPWTPNIDSIRKTSSQ